MQYIAAGIAPALLLMSLTHLLAENVNPQHSPFTEQFVPIAGSVILGYLYGRFTKFPVKIAFFHAIGAAAMPWYLLGKSGGQITAYLVQSVLLGLVCSVAYFISKK